MDEHLAKSCCELSCNWPAGSNLSGVSGISAASLAFVACSKIISSSIEMSSSLSAGLL